MGKSKAAESIRNRVKELVFVKAGELAPDPRNYRRHPRAQVDALRGVLAEIGYADALLARRTPEGLCLIDGHLRASLDPAQSVPVLVLDLDEAEAGKLLLTLDPLAAMAQADSDALVKLLDEARFEDKAVNDMLEALANLEHKPMPDWSDMGTANQDTIDQREQELERAFAEKVKARALEMVALICPECGKEFGIRRGDIDKESLV